jgi:hypothetical protein
MFGIKVELNRGLIVLPILFLGYAATNTLLEIANLGVSTQIHINIMNYSLNIGWQIGATKT